MIADLPPFKDGEHNSESVSTIDRVINPLRLKVGRDNFFGSSKSMCLKTYLSWIKVHTEQAKY